MSYVKLHGEHGLDILGNLIECNNDSIHHTYYGPINAYARHTLGYAHLPLDEHKVVPSALEHYETTLRDPVIYQGMKKILNKVERYINHMAPYTKDELTMPGVEITGVKMNPLITYIDHFHSDLTNAVWYNEKERHGSFRIRVRQERMNHKPFSYRLSVKSTKDQQVSIRVFLGPKYDEYGRVINLTENRRNFITMDHLIYDLKAGENVILRSSHDFSHYVPDRLPYWRLWEMINVALNHTEEFNVPHQNSILWPQR